MKNTIRPSADLRNHYADISRQVKETREPVFITVNGKGDTVLLNLNDYYQMQAELELLRTLADSEEDVRSGRVAPMSDTFNNIKKTLLESDK